MYYKGDLKLIKKNGKITVTNGCWEVTHNAKNGGCISEIRFIYGSNKNILVSPISTYFSFYKKYSYQDKFERSPNITVLENTPDRIKIQTEGKFYREDGKSIPAEYNYIYEYRNEYIKIIRRITCKKVPDDIHIIGVGSLELIPELNEYAYRFSPANEVGGDFHSWLKSCCANWGIAAEACNPLFCDHHASYYLAAFNRGVEGIETFPNSQIDEWEKQFCEQSSLSRFAIHRLSDPPRLSILMEPYFCCQKPIHPDGKFSFTSYLGLPNITKNSKAQYRHVGINNHPWPTDEQIKNWAYAGVNLLRLHNCDDLPDGNYWHRGCYPPYDEEGMRELDRVIATAHRYGMKVINYFSSDLHSKAPGFKNIKEWQRTVEEGGKPAQSAMAAHYDDTLEAADGGLVIPTCLESGFKKYLQDFIKMVLEKHKFDGVYYDCYGYHYCNNPLHSKGQHSMVDGYIEMTEWTRKAVGKEGVLIIHQSAMPSVIIENFADAILTMEEIDGERFIIMDIPALDGFTPHCEFMKGADHLICPTILRRAENSRSREEAWRNFTSKLVLLGLFSYGAEEPNIEMFTRFRAFDLTKYQFRNYRNSPVTIEGEKAKSSFYWNENEALIVLSNPSPCAAAFSWTLDISQLNWKNNEKYVLVDSLGEDIKIKKQNEILKSGIQETLGSYQYRIYLLKKHLPNKPYVQYNTYPSEEEATSRSFAIKTSGPLEQKATLNFYSPKNQQT